MNVIILIGVIVLSIAILFFMIKVAMDRQFLVKAFKNGSTITCGAKGKGKDLLFQYVIYHTFKRKKRPINYISNMDYGYGANVQPINTLNIDPNTFKSFIDGNIKPIQKNNFYEGRDYYLSDGGVYLPSQYDSELVKKYPSFSLYYALSRQLYNQNIHVNTQSLDRVWKKVREQADTYFLALGKVKIFNLIFFRVRYYENYDSCQRKLKPINSRLFNKYSKAETDIYQAQYGEIKTLWCLISTKHIKYDTRAFHETLFGYKYQDTKKLHNKS